MEVRHIPGISSNSYQEFIRSTHLSVGVYRLRAGDTDLQTPHGEDEFYLVLEGRARFTAGDRTVDVEPNLCLFVPSGEPHRFHDITDDLVVLVAFGPAEGSRATKGT